MLLEIANLIKSSDKIAILPHLAADGDALGSALALALAVVSLQKEALIVLEEDPPSTFDFLPWEGLFDVYGNKACDFSTVVAVDCGDVERLGLRKQIFERAAVTVNIDHHNTNTSFAAYNYVDTKSSATAEIIYRLLPMLGAEVDSKIALCLYVAISTDTGGFRYSNTTSATHMIAAKLIEAGIDIADITKRVFDTTSFEKVKLTGEAIRSIELYEGGKVAVITLTNRQFIEAGAKDEDSDGIINIARNITNVEVAAMLRELDNGEIKVNLRSNMYFDVSKIAIINSGGGHKRAAGYTVKSTLENAKNKLLSDIRKAL